MQEQRPPIKHCLVCGVAMFASKSDENASVEDIFICHNCGSQMIYSPHTTDQPENGDD